MMPRDDHDATREPSASVKPLLKWVGGKRQLLPELRRFYPASFGSYIEPFFGSGAVFFDLHQSGALHGHDVVLMDSNADLIGCYEMVRDAPDAVIGELESLAAAHATGGSAAYYEVRDARFNPERSARRGEDGRIAYTPALAAMLIYLNRTGFNGLFRVNAKGAFNVPAGRYARPTIADADRVHRVSRALASPRVRLIWGSFLHAREIARPQDFLYVDPPYAPLSTTSSFREYTTPRFDQDAQRRLQAMLVELAARGCHVLLSNSTASEISQLYEDDEAAKRVGLRALRVSARRAINSNGAGRGAIDEYLITNITHGGAGARTVEGTP